MIKLNFKNHYKKAFVLSLDDGNIEDRILIDILNKYQIIGSFNLNSGLLGRPGKIDKSEINNLYRGHEIAIHTVNHPDLNGCDTETYVNEIIRDRKELEKITGKVINGMGYPFGTYDLSRLNLLKSLGIKYSRTIEATNSFKIPSNFLILHPTMHYLDKDNNGKYIKYDMLESFLNETDTSIFYMWMHSWELNVNSTYISDCEIDKEKLDEFDKFCFDLASHKDILFTSSIDLINYIEAFNRLEFSCDNNIVYNPNCIDLFFEKDNRQYVVNKGETINLR